MRRTQRAVGKRHSRVLEYLSGQPERSAHEGAICKATEIDRSALAIVLLDLAQGGSIDVLDGNCYRLRGRRE